MAIFWSFLIFYHFLFFNALRRFRIAFLIGRFLILDPFLQPTVKIIKRVFAATPANQVFNRKNFIFSNFYLILKSGW